MEQFYVLEQVREKLCRSIMAGFRHVKVKKAELGYQTGMLCAAILFDRDTK